MEYTKYYGIAGFTIKVISDLPIGNDTFLPKFKPFEVENASSDVVTIHHHFKLPDEMIKTGQLVYKERPWEIYEEGLNNKYFGVLPDDSIYMYAEFQDDHSNGHIYHSSTEVWDRGGLYSLTAFPTDQILVARLISKRGGTYFHSAGAILNGNGIIFTGHSTAGKTTISKMVQPFGEILCDDRNIARKIDGVYNLYGTWSHGELDHVSASFAPLKAIYFLEKANYNEVVLMEDKKEIIFLLLSLVVRPLVTKKWWEEIIETVEDIAKKVPVYRLYFDKSGDIIKKI